MFKDVVSSKQELRALYGEPNERAVLKCKAALDEHSRAFIAAAPFILLATSNAAGQSTATQKSSKRSPPGSVTCRPRATSPASCWCWTRRTS